MRHIEAWRKVSNWKYRVTQISEKGYDLLLGSMHFTGNNDYQNFLVFAPMFKSLVLNGNKKVSKWNIDWNMIWKN